MKFWEYFEKIIAIITPQYTRKIYLERSERLREFFKIREEIETSNQPEHVKTIQLNAAVSGLTGAKFSNIEEFDFFLENFDPNRFEEDYFVFARNRVTYETVRDEHGAIISIKSITRQRWSMTSLNCFLVIVFIFAAAGFIVNFHNFSKALNKDLGIPELVNASFFLGVLFICFLTIFKVIYEWDLWSGFNRYIKNKFR
jgi:uncharacterized membrane protein YidH (DUF202 family)